MPLKKSQFGTASVALAFMFPTIKWVLGLAILIIILIYLVAALVSPSVLSSGAGDFMPVRFYLVRFYGVFQSTSVSPYGLILPFVQLFKYC